MGLADTRMSPFWILAELRKMEVVSGDNWSYKTSEAPVSNHHHQQTNFLQAGDFKKKFILNFLAKWINRTTNYQIRPKFR